jgi:hypothetical protein
MNTNYIDNHVIITCIISTCYKDDYYSIGSINKKWNNIYIRIYKKKTTSIIPYLNDIKLYKNINNVVKTPFNRTLLGMYGSFKIISEYILFHRITQFKYDFKNKNYSLEEAKSKKHKKDQEKLFKEEKLLILTGIIKKNRYDIYVKCESYFDNNMILLAIDKCIPKCNIEQFECIIKIIPYYTKIFVYKISKLSNELIEYILKSDMSLNTYSDYYDYNQNNPPQLGTIIIRRLLLNIISKQKNRIELFDNLPNVFIRECINEIVTGMVDSDNVEMAKWLVKKDLLPANLIMYPWNRKLRLYLNR